MKKILLVLLVVSFILPVAFANGGSEEKGSGSKSDMKNIKIGLSLPTQREERWVRDKETMEAYAQKMGVELVVQVADADAAQQAQQVDNLLTQGINVLILAPHDAVAAAQLVEHAAAEGIPVISYDRLVTGTEKLDYYLSFDNEKVGQMQGEYLVKQVPQGNIMVFAGAPTDNNAKLFYDGAMSKIQPLVDSGKLTIINGTDRFSRSVENWVPANAQRMAEDILTKNSDVQGVLAPNDGTAGGIIEALRASGITGIPITGQDAEVAAAKRILKGEQSMTIFKDTRELGKAAIDAAIKLGKGESVQTSATVDNGKIQVPSILLAPTVITKDNVQSLVDAGVISKLKI